MANKVSFLSQIERNEHILAKNEEIQYKWLDGAFVSKFRFNDFQRFPYDKVLLNSDFFEETVPQIARYAPLK